MSFAEDFVARLNGKIPDYELKTVMNELQRFVCNYDITDKETALSNVNGMPKEFMAYMVTKKIEGCSEDTLELYKLRLKEMFIGIGKSVDQITQNDIRAFLYSYQKQRGVSDRTLDHFRVIINGFLTWCHNDGYIQTNPCAAISPIKYEVKPRNPYSDMELEILRDSCSTLRDKAMVETLFSSGCRCSELCNLKISDVDFNTREIHLFGKGKKHRVSYINAKAVLYLKKYLNSRDDNSEYLFVSSKKPHGELKKGAVEKRMRQLGMSTGIANVIPHRFRHTMASVCIERGMPVTDIQRLLGHENLETTMIYAKTNQALVSMSHRRCVV